MTFNVHTIKGPFPALPSHVNAYVVEMDNTVVVVDGTAALSSGNELREKADSFGKPVKAVLVTHGHPDHFTGLVPFDDLPRFASQGCIDFAHREDEEKWESGKQYLGDDFPDKRIFPNKPVEDGATLTFGNVAFRFRFMDLGPGESDADSCWWIEVDDVVHAFIGDIITNNAHGFFGDGHAFSWLNILDRLEEEFDDNTKFYIGHGDTPVGKEMIPVEREYIQHFLDLVRDLDRDMELNEETLGPVVGAMREYLPTDSLLFLLAYELEKGIPRIWAQMDGRRKA